MLVEIWSDVACPWCYVGKRRFEQALAGFEHRDDVQVIWRSFELDPSAPAAVKGDRAARIAAKYGTTVEQARAMEQRMVDTAAAEGLRFRFDIARSGTTFDAHRLIHLAEQHDLGDAMKERLLRAYFTEGELMSDQETLARLAGEVGLDEEDARAALGGERYAAEVRDDEQTAAALGITAVPTFVIDRAFGVSGAQPPSELLAFLRQGWDARRPGEPVLAVGDSCAADGC
ncbi:MAG: DsbA family oxidoreductase [Solirubrobacteraceae bacterium]|jgi:predicted DsbA family dithiol-disulfide isomerase